MKNRAQRIVVFLALLAIVASCLLAPWRPWYKGHPLGMIEYSPIFLPPKLDTGAYSYELFLQVLLTEWVAIFLISGVLYVLVWPWRAEGR